MTRIPCWAAVLPTRLYVVSEVRDGGSCTYRAISPLLAIKIESNARKLLEELEVTVEAARRERRATTVCPRRAEVRRSDESGIVCSGEGHGMRSAVDILESNSDSHAHLSNNTTQKVSGEVAREHLKLT